MVFILIINGLHLNYFLNNFLSYKNFADFVVKAEDLKVANFFKKVNEIATDVGASSFRLVSNNGAQAGQTIDHFHVHILAGKDFKTHL